VAAAVGEYFVPSYFDWQSERAFASAGPVVPLLTELVGPGSVVDFGCGTGAWLQAFVDRGVEDVVGLDGEYVERGDLRIAADRFVACDLAHPPSLARRFDLALSLEAVHYLSKDDAVGAVHWLTAHADVVYFAAAVPFQEGGPSLTRQWPAWWARLFAEDGLDTYDLLRPQLWEQPEVDWWYSQNGILYARPGALAGATPTGSPLPLVHPGLLADVAERGQVVTQPKAAGAAGLGGLSRRLRSALR
jgi:SAM-dependent methyltransferase